MGTRDRDRRPRLLKPAEVAEMLGVSVKTLYGWASAKTLPHVKPSRTVLRFWEHEILAWLEKRSVPPRDEGSQA